MRVKNISGALRVLLCCWLGLFAASTLVAGLAALPRPVSQDYGEPIVYGHAARILAGEPLYQPIDRLPFTIAAYPPLFYWAAAGVHALFGPGFAAVRALSFLAGLACAACVGFLAMRRSQPLTGLLAALLFLATAFPGEVPWLALYRVDLLGVALSLGAIALLSVRDRPNTPDTKISIAAGVLAGLALLTKQTFFAAALAGIVWLWWVDRKQALVFGATSAAVFGIPCLWLETTTHALLENTVVANVNPWDFSVLWTLGEEFLRTQLFPLFLALIYIVLARPWQHADERLPLLYWAASSIGLLGIAKVGANHNYWIEFAAATAVLAALGTNAVVVAWPTAAGRAFAAGVVAFGLVAGLGGRPGLEVAATTGRSSIRELRGRTPDAEFTALVNRVRAEPGAVLAEPIDVVVLAGKPPIFEPLVFSLLLHVGAWNPQSLVDHICHGDVRMAVLGYPLEEGASMAHGDYEMWPPPVVAAIDARMTLDSVEAGRFIYVPRPSATTCGER